MENPYGSSQTTLAKSCPHKAELRASLLLGERLSHKEKTT
jgi:hypothetical protein